MIEAKKVHRGLEFNQRHTMAKPQGEFNIHKKTIEAEKNDDTMTNVTYRTTLRNLRNGIDLRLISNQKNYLKWTSKPCSMSQ